MPAFTAAPTFLYPSSRQFPFDEVVGKIVRALESRNWSVEGLTVHYGYYGTGFARYMQVDYLEGEQFRLYFSRRQGTVEGGLSDSAAVTTLVIPEQELTVYDDESGPTYYVYAGDDWDADRHKFMHSIKVNSKLRGEARSYLRYSGDSRRFRSRPEILKHDSDLGREYSPEGDEPMVYKTQSVFNTYTKWLKNNVLDYILSFSTSNEVCSPHTPEDLIPYSGPPLYAVCKARDADLLLQAEEDIEQLMSHERSFYSGGLRLIPYSVPNDGTFPEKAYDGFMWCAVGSADELDCRSKLHECLRSGLDNEVVLRVAPKYANHLYVIDRSAYTDERESASIKMRLENSFIREPGVQNRGRFTDAEMNDMYIAQGRTLIPYILYKGDYADPLVLVNRELDFDEVFYVRDIRPRRSI